MVEALRMLNKVIQKALEFKLGNPHLKNYFFKPV
jgi:hypothetical protein